MDVNSLYENSRNWHEARLAQAVSPKCLILEYCFSLLVFNVEDQKRGPIDLLNGSEKQNLILNQVGVRIPQQAWTEILQRLTSDWVLNCEMYQVNCASADVYCGV